MKLMIQIPCFNEADTLPDVLSALPKTLAGFDAVEWLVVDDGSTDATSQVARAGGAHHVVRHTRNQGLARAFMSGLDACRDLGADVIVNLDADNQHDADDIPALVAPILDNRADIVVGVRPIAAIEHFTPVKKLLHRLGSRVVRAVSKTDIADAPSGFRALSRTAAARLVVFDTYTYTLETIIQAGQDNLAIMAVPVTARPEARPSRLVKSIPSYVMRSVATIIRIFVIYRPFRFFFISGTVLFTAGIVLGLRYLWLFLSGTTGSHLQSIILSGVLLGIGFQAILIAFIADLLAANRKLLMDIRFRLTRLERPDVPATKSRNEA